MADSRGTTSKGKGGSCTTPPLPPTLAPVAPLGDGSSISVGIDTISFAWRPYLRGAVREQLAELACGDGSSAVIDGTKWRRTYGGNLLSENPIDNVSLGLRVGSGAGKISPSTLWAEGRICNEPGRLATIDEALAFADLCEHLWRDLGVLHEDTIVTPRIRRIDIAADLRDKPSPRYALLDDLAAIPLDRHERARAWRDTYGCGTRTSGVDVFRTSGAKLHLQWRAYDKHLEQSKRSASPLAPGAHIRIERQLRFSGAERPLPRDVLTPANLAAHWAEPFTPITTPTHDLNAVTRVLADAITAGTVKAMVAARLLGATALTLHDPGLDASPATRLRNQRALADFGITRVTPYEINESTREAIMFASSTIAEMAPATNLYALDRNEDNELI